MNKSQFERNDDGGIHDRVTTSNGVAITVIAGTDADDTLGFMLHGAGLLSSSLVITAEEARRLGSLLLEAAADTLSREPTP